MKVTRMLVLGLGAMAVLFFVAGCEWTITASSPKAYVKFVNNTIDGGSAHYAVKNLGALGQTMLSELAYGATSSIIEVTPQSGAFVVTGLARVASTDDWVSVSWASTGAITAGDTFTVTLGAVSVYGYVRFLNLMSQSIVGGSVTYVVRNLGVLNQTLAGEVAYGNQSLVLPIMPLVASSTGDSITVSGEVRQTAGTSWVAGDWGFRTRVAAGDTVLLNLEF